jgi:hypothetical protein
VANEKVLFDVAGFDGYQVHPEEGRDASGKGQSEGEHFHVQIHRYNSISHLVLYGKKMWLT